MPSYLVTYIAKDYTRRKRRVESETPETAKNKAVQELENSNEPHVLRVVSVTEEV